MRPRAAVVGLQIKIWVIFYPFAEMLHARICMNFGTGGRLAARGLILIGLGVSLPWRSEI